MKDFKFFLKIYLTWCMILILPLCFVVVGMHKFLDGIYNYPPQVEWKDAFFLINYIWKDD